MNSNSKSVWFFENTRWSHTQKVVTLKKHKNSCWDHLIHGSMSVAAAKLKMLSTFFLGFLVLIPWDDECVPIKWYFIAFSTIYIQQYGQQAMTSFPSLLTPTKSSSTSITRYGTISKAYLQKPQTRVNFGCLISDWSGRFLFAGFCLQF